MTTTIERLGLQMFATTTMSLMCNNGHCRRIWSSGQSAVSLGASVAIKEGWRVDGACQVYCPKCVCMMPKEE